MTAKRPIRDLERELKKEPGNLALRLQLAAAYREVQRGQEAVELYRSVARAYAEQGRNGQAAMVCRSALELAPEDSELYGMLLHLERAGLLATPPAGQPVAAGARPTTVPPPPAAPAPSAPPPSPPAPVAAQPGPAPAGGTMSRTRVLPAEVSVRELGSVASTVKHAPPPPPPVAPAPPAAPPPPAEPPVALRPKRATGGPPPGALPPPMGVPRAREPTPTPTGRVSTSDVATPLPEPLPLHETTGRDSLIEMAELIGRPTPTPQPMLRSTGRSSTDDDSETVIPLTMVREPSGPAAVAAPAAPPPPARARPPSVAPPPPPAPPGAGPATPTAVPPSTPPPPPPGRAVLPRLTSATRPPPTRPPASRPPAPRAPSHADEALTVVRPELGTRPSEGDFAQEMQTRKRPKLSATDLALLDLERVEPVAEPPTDTINEALTDPGTDPDGGERAPTTPPLASLPVLDDDEPTHPPGHTPAGLVPPHERAARDTSTDVRASPHDTRPELPDVHDLEEVSELSVISELRDERAVDATLRGEPAPAGRSATEEVTAGTFDRSFDATLLALGPDGATLEGPLGVFSMLPADAAVELGHRAVVKPFQAGEVIIREGDPGDACYVIVHGEVAVRKRGPEGGDPVELARLSDGSLFGEFALLADRRRHATVVAVTDCEIYEIPRLLLRELAAIFPEVGPALETFYRERLLSNLLFTTPLFSLVPAEQRPALLARFHPLHAESGQAIVRQGERAGGLYLIVLGAVEVVRRVADRRAVVLATLGEGAYFGEMSLLSGAMASASVVAAGPCELAVLPPRDFYEIVAANPELWAAMRSEADARRLANAQILAGHTGVV